MVGLYPLIVVSQCWRILDNKDIPIIKLRCNESYSYRTLANA